MFSFQITFNFKNPQCRKASNHPNIVQILGICTKLPNLCIVLEYMQAGSLHKILHKDNVRFDSKSVCRIGLEITKGMLHLHSLNIIHRDLHTGNVLVNKIFKSFSIK